MESISTSIPRGASGLRGRVRRTARFLRDVALLGSDWVVSFAGSAARVPNEKIVLIVRLDALGDYVVWRNAAEAMISSYRRDSAVVVLAGNILWQDLALADLPQHSFIGVEPQRLVSDFIYRMRVMFRISRLRAGVTISPAYSRNHLTSDAMVRVSRAPVRVGYSGDVSNTTAWWHKASSKWFTTLVQNPASGSESHRNAHFARVFGVNVDGLLPQLKIDWKMLEFKLPGTPYVVISPGAGWAGRVWPTARFSAIAKWIHETYGFNVVLCGGASERLTAATIAKECEFSIVNLVGMTSAVQLAAVIAGSEMVISNETSSVHIAASVCVPAVAITGGGHFGRFVPYAVDSVVDGRAPRVVSSQMPCFGCNWICIYERGNDEPVACIDRVSVEKVREEVAKLMANRRKLS